MPKDHGLTEEQLELLDKIADDVWVLVRRGGISVPVYWVESPTLDASQAVDADDVGELVGSDLISVEDQQAPISRYRLTDRGEKVARQT